MKPKNHDNCPVCNYNPLESANGPEPQAQISWIRCDVCRQWYHSVCLKLTKSTLGSISSFHCPECEREHGPSHMKRQSKRARVKIDYVALDQGETFAVDKSVHPHVPSFLNFGPSVDLSTGGSHFVDVLSSGELTKEYVFATGLSKPVLVPDVTGESGLRLPVARDKITVEYISQKCGANASVEVMDVLSQQSETPSWSLAQWREYFYTPEAERDRIRNVISLEVSQTDELGSGFVRPKMVTDLDLVDKVWCDADGNDQKRPQVTVYCLMSVRGSYTDFHIDFSGTPVYYTVCHGTKTFLMYPPTDNNLALYESWCHEPQQNFTWFAGYTKRVGGKKIRPADGFKISLKKGDLFIIPSGWIHSVYTPDDAVIIGGNYLTIRDLPMHTRIYELEKHTRVPSKYRFPMFNKVLWLASWYYLNHTAEFFADLGISVSPDLQSTKASRPGPCSMQSSSMEGSHKDEDVTKANQSKDDKILENVSNRAQEKHINSNIKSETLDSSVDMDTMAPEKLASSDTSQARDVLSALIAHLTQHYEISKTQQIAKKSIPSRLIGRNVKEYIAKLESWRDSL
ncbi:hypothetical protein OXX59_008883 [Metschnikowia pulcherrima]